MILTVRNCCFETAEVQMNYSWDKNIFLCAVVLYIIESGGCYVSSIIECYFVSR